MREVTEIEELRKRLETRLGMDPSALFVVAGIRCDCGEMHDGFESESQLFWHCPKLGYQVDANA